jgi:hypothetical protein
MEIRFYIDPENGTPHIHRHGVRDIEVEDVLGRPLEDRPGRDGSRVALGQSRQGRYLRVVYVPDPSPGSVFVITAYPLGPKALRALRRRRKNEDMRQDNFPPGWDEERVRRVLEHYANQSDDEAVAEDEAAFESTTHTAMGIPVELVPEVRELLAKRRVG